MNEDRPPRLFTAFDVPETLLRAVEGRIQSLRRALPEARWIPASNQHVTLRFFGSTPLDRLDPLRLMCRQVAAATPPAELHLTSLGAFPNVRRARVVWIGIDDPAGASTALQQGLEAGARSLGFEPEERPYTPHLTLARLKRPAPLPPEAEDLSFVDLPAFELSGITLYCSHLSSKGARYEVVDRFPLG